MMVQRRSKNHIAAKPGGPRALLLSVALPRLAAHSAEVVAWVDRYGSVPSEADTATMARLPGSEGLAFLAGLSNAARLSVIDEALLDDEQRRELVGVAQRLGDSDDPESAASALARLLPPIEFHRREERDPGWA